MAQMESDQKRSKARVVVDAGLTYFRYVE